MEEPDDHECFDDFKRFPSQDMGHLFDGNGTSDAIRFRLHNEESSSRAKPVADPLPERRFLCRIVPLGCFGQVTDLMTPTMLAEHVLCSLDQGRGPIGVNHAKEVSVASDGGEEV